jgi:predicted site-specific integrase-resolvase
MPVGGSMSIEKHLSLNQAARMGGISGKTLKVWMERDLGICFPVVVHGAKLLVLERDVEFVLAKRRDARNPRRQPRT